MLGLTYTHWNVRLPPVLLSLSLFSFFLFLIRFSLSHQSDTVRCVVDVEKHIQQLIKSAVIYSMQGNFLPIAIDWNRILECIWFPFRNSWKSHVVDDSRFIYLSSLSLPFKYYRYTFSHFNLFEAQTNRSRAQHSQVMVHRRQRFAPHSIRALIRAASHKEKENLWFRLELQVVLRWNSSALHACAESVYLTQRQEDQMLKHRHSAGLQQAVALSRTHACMQAEVADQQ